MRATLSPVRALVLAFVCAACGSFGASPAEVRPGDEAGAARLDASACGHAFCSNFDGRSLEEGWDGVLLHGNTNGLRLERSDAAPRSVPFVLRGTLEPGTRGGAGHFVHKTFAGAASVRLGFAFRAETAKAGASELLQIATIGWAPKPGVPTDMLTEVQVLLSGTLVIARTDEDLPDGSDDKVKLPNAKSFLPGEWHEVSIHVEKSAGPDVTASVTFDGQTLGSRSFTPRSPFVDPDVGVGLAGAYGTFAETTSVDFDDAWVDVE
jgi:hypothetical protein